MRTVAFCEIDPFCRRVLAKHWPHVPCYPDVRELSADRLKQMDIRPRCHLRRIPLPRHQHRWPKGAGIEGERSGLWSSTPELLANLDPDSSSWRTSQRCFIEGLTEFLETWPRSGLMRSGTAFRLPPLVRLTEETEYGLLPTPSATPYGSNQGGAMGRTGPVRASLQTMARKGMWPTPTREDAQCAGSRKHSPTVYSIAVTSMGERPGSLNPEFVEWLMGFPIGWTACPPLATPSSRKSRKSSGEPS
jgi:hypothetical protein